MVNELTPGARGTTLEGDIAGGVKPQRRPAEEEQVPRRVEFLDKNQSEPFTGEDLEGACAVVDQDGAAYGLVRVNRKTVTVSWDEYDTYRWSFNKIYRLIRRSR